MKKILALIFMTCSLFLVTSCNNSEQTTDNTSLKTQIGLNWLNDSFEAGISYNPINEFKVGKDHYEYSLAKDIESSVRYSESVLTADSLSDNQKAYASYLSTSRLEANVYSDLISNLLECDEVTNLDIIEGNEVQDSIQKEIELPQDYKTSKENRVIVIAYLPVNVQYITYDDDDNRFISLYTYILCPIYVSATYKVNSEYQDSNLSDLSIEKYEITYKNGLLN